MKKDFPANVPDPPALFDDKSEYVALTIAQVEKDFQLQGVALQLPQNPETYEELIQSLASVLRDLFLVDSAALSRLRYQIDLPEKIESTSVEDDDWDKVLSDQIIRRCFLKVYFRKNYQ